MWEKIKTLFNFCVVHRVAKKAGNQKSSHLEKQVLKNQDKTEEGKSENGQEYESGIPGFNNSTICCEYSLHQGIISILKQDEFALMEDGSFFSSTYAH